MFTGLFLAPWMLMYALSTLVMAHHEYVSSFYSSKSPAMMAERELDYSRSSQRKNGEQLVLPVTKSILEICSSGRGFSNVFNPSLDAAKVRR